MEIDVDFREKHRDSVDVCNEMDKQKVKYNVVELKIGDFVVRDNDKVICIERKLISDFISSIYDFRLMKQLKQMEDNFSNSFIIVIGNLESYKKKFFLNDKLARTNGNVRNISPWARWKKLEEVYLGLKASIACRYQNIKFIEVDNDEQFVKMLLKIANKSTDGKVVSDLWLVEKKSREKVFVNILNSFPNMGDDRIKSIVDSGYINVKDLQIALYEGFFDVPGIGKKTVALLKEELL